MSQEKNPIGAAHDLLQVIPARIVQNNAGITAFYNNVPVGNFPPQTQLRQKDGLFTIAGEISGHHFTGHAQPGNEGKFRRVMVSFTTAVPVIH